MFINLFRFFIGVFVKLKLIDNDDLRLKYSMGNSESFGTVLLKIWCIFDHRQRRNAVILLFFLLVGVGLEKLGIGMIVPLIALLSGNSLVENYPSIQNLLLRLGNPTPEVQIIGFMVVMVVVFAVKNLYLAFLAYIQSRYSFNVRKIVSKKLFKNYIKQPYSFHLQRNTAQLIQIITEESTVFATAVLIPLLLLISEVLVAISMSCLLLYMTSWLSMLSILILGVGGILFYQVLRKRLKLWGELRQYHEGQRIQNIQQGFGAIRDIKLLGREEAFLGKFEYHNKMDARLLRNNSIANQLPRLWFEMLAISGLAFIVVLTVYQNEGTEKLITIIGLFAAASFRLAPSATRIMSALQKLRFSHVTVNTIADELNNLPDSNNESGNFICKKPKLFKNFIRLRNVSYKYPLSSALSLNNINLDIHKGQTVGFIGTSGAGKTTLVNVVLGLLKPTSGEILVDEKNINENLRCWQDQIGYVPQSIYLSDDSLKSNIAFGIREQDIEPGLINKAVQMANLSEFITSLPDGIETIVGERGTRLSGGQQQRIGIARALYHQPSVLVLDEATSALDTKTEKEVMKAIQNLHGQKTILIIAHRLSTVETCDVIFKLEHGKLQSSGTYVDIIEKH